MGVGFQNVHWSLNKMKVKNSDFKKVLRNLGYNFKTDFKYIVLIKITLNQIILK